MQNIFSKIKGLVTVFLVLALLATALPFQTLAADTQGMIFSGNYKASGNKLILTVSVDNPTINVDSAMFVLKYDTSLFTVSSSDVYFLGDAQRSAVYYSNSGYIGADWYYVIEHTDPALAHVHGLAASSTPTAAVKIVFTLKSGKSFSNLKSNSITVCTDTAYLNSINGYGSDGGVLLCNGLNYYNYNSGTAYGSISFNSTTTQVIRLAGTSRVDTSLAIANKGWENGADTVIITNGYNFADALAGGPLATALNAPILLTANKATIETSVLNKINALGATNAIILGGEGAVNNSIRFQLEAKGLNVKRIYGISRFDTAIAIANELYAVTGSYSDKVFVAYSHNYPDALAISPVAAITGTPIVFVNAKGIFDNATSNYLRQSGVHSATILGGTGAVPKVAETNLKNIGVASVNRIFGTSRYDTALEICKTYNNVFTSNDVALATGTSFPDALAGGAFSAKMGIPIILVNPKSAPSSAINYIAERGANKAYIFGGEGAVPNATVSAYLQQ